MSNFETFILVMIMLLPVAYLLGSVILLGLEHSRETHEILRTPQTFTTSGWRYLLSFDVLVFSFILIVFIYLIIDLLQKGLHSLHSYASITLCIAVVPILLYNLYIVGNYWKYTKDMEIHFEPENKTISVNTGTKTYVVQEKEMVQLDVFTNNRRKIKFSYYRFTLQNGESFILADRTPGLFGILTYFKNIPTHYHTQLFPIIR